MDFASPSSMPIALGFGFAILIGLVLILWALLYSKATRGTDMDRPNWGTQFYAYSVCIIAVVVFLSSLTGLLGSAFDAAQPLRSHGGFGAAVLTSFDAYKATYDREQRLYAPSATPTTPPSDEELHRRYDALRQDRIDGAKYEFLRSLVTDLVLLGLTTALFIVHWRLAGRVSRVGASGAA
jgi:hypothetical protein